MPSSDQIDNRILGRGELHFGKFLEGTYTPEGELYMGNTPEFNLTIESEQLDHFSSDHGVNELDDSVPLSTNRTANMITDNISPDNLALLFLGDASVQVQSATPVVDEVVVSGLTTKANMWYQLGVTVSNPTGVREVTAVTIKNGTTNTALVLGTDYELDAAMGRFRIITGGAGAGIAIKASYTPAAKSRTRVISKGKTITGSLRFIADNPAGKDFDYYMPRVQITANGDFALKGDEWQQISFTVKILKRDSATEALYIDGRPY